MATGEDEPIDLSDDDDFEFKPAAINDINCWGSNLLNDLESINPIKEDISHVEENTNGVSELPCVANIKTEGYSDAKLNSESAATSSVEEINVQLSTSDGLVTPTEENEEAELVSEVNTAKVVIDEDLEAKTSVEEIVDEKKNALDEQLKEDSNELQQLDEVVDCDTVLESVKRHRPGPKSKTNKLDNSDSVNEPKETKISSPNTSDGDVNSASELRDDQNEVQQLDEAVADDTVLESVERRRPGPKSKTNKLEISDNLNEPNKANLDSVNTLALVDSGVKSASELREDQNEVQQLEEAVPVDTVLESVERRRPGPKSKTNKLEISDNTDELNDTNVESVNTLDTCVMSASELREDQNEVQQLEEAVTSDTVLESVERRRPGPKSKTNKLEISDNTNEPNNTIVESVNTLAMVDSGDKSASELREDQNKVQEIDEAVACDTVLESVERRRPGPKSKSNKLEISDNANEPKTINLDSSNTTAMADSGFKCASELKEDQNEIQQLDEAIVVDSVMESAERRRPGPKSKTKKLENDSGVESELKEVPIKVEKLSETAYCDTLGDSIENRRPGPKSKTSFHSSDNSDGVNGPSEMKEAQNEVPQLSGTIICDTHVEKRRPGPKSKTSLCNSNSSAQNEVQKLSETVTSDTLVEGVERRRPGPKSKTIIWKNGENAAEHKKEEKNSEIHSQGTRIYSPNSSGNRVKSSLKEEQKILSRPGPKSKTCNLKNGESVDSSKKKRKHLSQEFVDDSDSNDSNAANGGVRSSKEVKVEPIEFMQTSGPTAFDTSSEKNERRPVGRPKSKQSLLKNGENAGEPKEKKRKILSPKYVGETHFGSPNPSARMDDGVKSSGGKGSRYVPNNIEIPLQLGWKREIVHRATFSGTKRMADAYYTSPKGKKLRSMNEVEQYLHLTGETSVKLDMFSYYKTKLTDHENESERYAKKADKKGGAEVLPDEILKMNKSPKNKHLEATSTEVPHKHNKTEKKKKEKKSLSCSSSNNNDSIGDLNPFCNGFCEGYMGQLPDMNCVSCFCLFHPKCVGIFSSEEASDFICQNCLHQQSGGAVPEIKSTKSHHSNTSENKLQTLKIKKRSHKTMETHSSQVPQTSSSAKQENNLHTPSSGLSLNKKLKTYERTVKSSPSKNITLVPIRIVSPSSGAPIISNLSSSHARVLSSYPDPIPGTSEVVEIQPGPEIIDLDLNINCAPLELRENNNCNDYSNWTCTLPLEAEALAKTFKYLHTKDLFQMKLVCTSWNAVASRPFLWNHIYLQGLMVTDWNLLADFLEAKNVVMLNMRGMKMGKDICEMWRQFNSILPRLANIKELMLCKIPASIPYRLASKLPHLTHIATEEIFDSKVDPNRGCKLFMGKFNKLTELRRLKLNGFKGLFIPKSIISDEFLNTDALKNLKHLSLTTFTGITSSQLESLSLLPDLTILELGNCSDWTDEHFLRIGLLTNLRKLRLEYGGTKESPVLCEVLKKLPELQTLELVLFNIPENFIQVLPCLKNLQLLTVWPNEENGAANSYRLTKALKTMTRLKKFVWGLVASQLVREAAVQKQMDDKVLCIPYFAEQNASKGKLKWSEDRICANDLMERLRLILPNTIIRVVIVSSKSYSSIRQASASK